MITVILSALIVFLVVILLLVVLLLWIRSKLVPQGDVNITINNDKELTVHTGGSLISTLAEHGVYLPSACGGKGSCGQCKCRVTEGGGTILPTEEGFFTRKQIKDNWRLACQVKVRENMKIVVPQSVLSIKEYECEVISNSNVATFIKEFKVRLPKGASMDFEPGSYAQIKIPTFNINYSDFDRSLIGEEYLPAWEKMKMFDLKCQNSEPTVRAYSMANYPAEGDIFMLTVRIATPPLNADRSGFLDVSPGIASSYIFSLKPGDKVIMSGPYGDFHIRPASKDIPAIWVGGGAGMAPLRAQIMHLTRTLEERERELHYFYGARAFNEVFYFEDFMKLQEDFPNFKFHLALDRPDPVATEANIKYDVGFVHTVMYETFLKNHPFPEDIDYYMCGPGPMSKAVVNMLDSLGVPESKILYDDFGA